MSLKRFIQKAERSIADVRDPAEKSRRARDLALECQGRGREALENAKALQREEEQARDILQSPHARRWRQYLGAGVSLFLADAFVQAWTFTVLTMWSRTGAVVAGAVTAAALAVFFHFLGCLCAVDVYSEQVTRRRHHLSAAVGSIVAVAGAVGYRLIGTLSGQEAAIVASTLGWAPFAAMCIGLPLGCGSLTSLGLYYLNARRALGRLARSAAALNELATLYTRLIAVPEPKVTALDEEAAAMPAWVGATGTPDVFDTPAGRVLRRENLALTTGTERSALEAPTSTSTSTATSTPMRKRRGRPRGSRKHVTIPDPEPGDSFRIPDPDDDGSNGGGSTLIPPVVRGLAVLLISLFCAEAMAAPCFVGIDGTNSNDSGQLVAGRDFAVSSAADLASTFGCDTLITSIVLDQGRWTPRRRIAVPSRPTQRDCSKAHSRPSSDVERLYEPWRAVREENDKKARSACEIENESALRAYQFAKHAFEKELRAALTVHEPRADLRSPIFSWLQGTMAGSEIPALVVFVGDGLENPAWPRPVPKATVPSSTTVVFLLVPPRPSYRDPQRALEDVQAWSRVVPGIVLVPVPELRPGLWADIAGRRRPS